MNKSFVALGQLLISDQKLTKPVKPGVRRLHNPTPVFQRTPPFALLSCNPRGISTGADLLANHFAVISLIRIQVSLFFGRGDDDSIKHCGELADIMSIGPGNDQRQRDATPVHQQVSLASFFSPCPSGSDRLPLAPEAL